MNYLSPGFIRRLTLPILLMLITPPMVILIWYTNVFLNGSLTNLMNIFINKGPFKAIYEIWSPYFLGSKTSWNLIIIFSFIQLLFMKYLPGKTIYGPVTPKGNIPEYKDNGLFAYLLTLTLFLLSTGPLHLFKASIIYDEFGYLLSALNLLSLIFCLFLYFKGKFFPSSSDCGSNGNIFFDYFWGRELYPRIFGFDVKVFTNCRFGMMAWPLILISFALKQQEVSFLSNSILISVTLQIIYISKFFIWEKGYLCSMDIMHDRAGYYLCWGCMVFVPGFYTSATLYMVNHPFNFSFFNALIIFFLGALFILLNYQADRQRQKVRLTNGNCKIFGKAPNVISAHYKTDNGEEKENLLLISGYWAISRHIHYVFEILAAFFWSMPALFESILPYGYLIFLILLLLDRARRQEKRCQAKYGLYWQQYCTKVPYKLIPYVF
jgi:7-dehydrocholesterol reductase